MTGGAEEIPIDSGYGCSKTILDPLSSLSLMNTVGSAGGDTETPPNGKVMSGPGLDDGMPNVANTAEGSNGSNPANNILQMNDREEVSLNRRPTDTWTCVEDFKRFSESILWTFMVRLPRGAVQMLRLETLFRFFLLYSVIALLSHPYVR